MIEEFRSGHPETRRKLNVLVRVCRIVKALTGDDFIRAHHTDKGLTLRLNIDEVVRRIPKYNDGGRVGIGLRRAYVKTAPGATTTLVCFLDVYTTGTQVNVECDIYGGGNLDEAHPTLVDGDPLWVAYNAVAGEWQNVTRIDGSEDCEV